MNKKGERTLNRIAVEDLLTSWRGFAIVATGAALLILVAGRSASFYSDDWWYILGRSLGDPRTWFVAENEHWVTLHVIAIERSEERRVGKECSKQCRSRWSPYH